MTMITWGHNDHRHSTRDRHSRQAAASSSRQQQAAQYQPHIQLCLACIGDDTTHHHHHHQAPSQVLRVRGWPNRQVVTVVMVHMELRMGTCGNFSLIQVGMYMEYM